MVTLFAVLSALSYGVADFTGGIASRKSPVSAVVAWSQAVGIVVALAAVPFLGGTRMTAEAWIWGAVAGLSGAAGLSSLYKGLATGLASVVSPTAAVTGAALPVFVGLVLGERPELSTWIGIALALPAILLLTSEKGEHKGTAAKSLRMGLVAGLGFGGFFVFVSRTPDSAGLWPLVAARSASVPALVIVTLLQRKSLALAKGTRLTALGAGAMDMAANVFYLIAARSGMLITAVVITALYPAPTVLLQRMAFKERLGPARIAGLLLALAGIALIGMD